MDRFKNIPAFKFAVLFAAGIFIGSKIQFNPAFLIAILLLLALASFYFIKKITDEYLLFGLMLCLVIVSGVFKSNIDFFSFPRNSIDYIPDTQRKVNYELIGIVKEIPEADEQRVRLVLKSMFIVTAEDSIPVAGDVMVNIRRNIYGNDEYEPPALRPGDKISLLGKLGNASGERNPGEFDYKKYLRLHDIYRTFTVFGYENAILLSHNNLGFFEQYIIFPAKLYALNNIDTHIKGDEGAYLKGLVTGERSGLTDEVKESFVNTGAMHLLAVSGLNVAYIVLIFSLLLSLLRVPKIYALGIIISILIFYCFFTGSPASIVRATVMGGLFLAALHFERKADFYNLTGIAAMVILLIDAKQLFDAGFILSFTAIITMVFIYEKFEKLFVKKIPLPDVNGKRHIYYLIVLLFTTIAAQIGTLPITAIFFGRVSLIAPFANLIVPVSNLSLGLGLFQVMAGVFSEFLASVIASFNQLVLTGQLLFINWCASLKFAYIDFYRFNVYNTIVYFIVILIVFSINKKNYLPRVIVIVLLITSVFIYNADFKTNLTMVCFDVGHGESTLIATPDGRTILIDCGTSSGKFNSGERTIIPYLKRNNIDKIDVLILTAMDKEHTGGAEHIIRNYPVGKIFYSDEVNEEFEKVMTAAYEKNIQHQKVVSGDIITGFEDLRLYFLSPPGDENEPKSRSIVTKIKFRETEFLLTSNIEAEDEMFLSSYYDEFLRTNVLKAANFGSEKSNAESFLSRAVPKYTVISAGLFNRKNLPDDIVIERLRKEGSDIHQIAINGAFIIESDGEQLDVIDWK